MRTALITGVAGQDGSYLSELLIEKGYAVYGVAKSSSPPDLWRLKSVLPQIRLVKTDLTDQSALVKLIESCRPDEIYNLASPSFVPNSWNEPLMTTELSAVGVLKLLEAIRSVNPKIKFFQAGSAEVFGKAESTPQSETTPFHPMNPYAVAKVYAHFMVGNYRRYHGIFGCNGLMFNHESPRRSPEFVPRKITSAVAKIKAGKMDKLALGNLDAQRDWGYAKDYVEVMWLMLQQREADDFVVSTGQSHSVRELVDLAFSKVNLDYRKYVVLDEKFVRPPEKIPLLGDCSKAKNKLGWYPRTTFEEIINLMVEADMKAEGLVMAPSC